MKYWLQNIAMAAAIVFALTRVQGDGYYVATNSGWPALAAYGFACLLGFAGLLTIIHSERRKQGI